MGYTKIIQYGDLIEVYNYKNNVHQKRIRTITRRIRQNDKYARFRSRRSIQRTKENFIRFVHANVSAKGVPTFITFTNYQEVSLSLGYEYLRKCIRNIRKFAPECSFIAVPEWQKTGRLHFHCLFWGLPKKTTKKGAERKSRLYQRQWARGYVDVRDARNTSFFLSLYLAKYMSKASTDSRLSNQRAYSSSYNVVRPYSAGSNSLSPYLSTFIPNDKITIKEYNYETPFLGKCNYSQYKVINYEPKS